MAIKLKELEKALRERQEAENRVRIMEKRVTIKLADLQAALERYRKVESKYRLLVKTMQKFAESARTRGNVPSDGQVKVGGVVLQLDTFQMQSVLNHIETMWTKDLTAQENVLRSVGVEL